MLHSVIEKAIIKSEAMSRVCFRGQRLATCTNYKLQAFMQQGMEIGSMYSR